MSTPRQFLERAINHQGTECLEWPFSKNNGYGRIRITRDGGYKLLSVPRLVLERTQGPPPELGMHVCHQAKTCHNRACVNPAHLRWGTAAENSADKVLDDTNSRAGLTRDDVEYIRLYEAWLRPDTLAAMSGVTRQTIRNIQAGRTWQHVKVNGETKVRGVRFKSL